VTRPRLLVTIQIVAALVLWALVLLLAARTPWRLDLTPTKDFTLSARTLDVLDRLSTDVEITYFYSSQDAVIRRNTEALLSLYTDASPRLHVRMVDLDRNPGLATGLGVSSYNVAVIASTETRFRLDLVNEEILTAALLRLAGTPPLLAYVVQGHGERPLSEDERLGLSQAAQSLAGDRIHTRPLSGAAKIPDDADLLIVAGATTNLAEAEIDTLDAHLRDGRHVIVLAEAPTPPSIAEWLLRYGIELGADVVVDRQSRLLGADGLSARIAYLNQSLIPSSPEVNGMLPVAQTIRLIDTPGVESDYLALTGEQTWADVDHGILSSEHAVAGPDDRRGPLPVAVIARVEPNGGRLLVVGDADFATNLHVDVLGNRELLLALVGLVVRDEAVVAARPTSEGPSPLSAFVVTTTEARLVLWLGAVVPAALLAGIAVVRRRRLG